MGFGILWDLGSYFEIARDLVKNVCWKFSDSPCKQEQQAVDTSCHRLMALCGFFNFLFCIEVQLIKNVMTVSGEQ